MQAHEVEHRVHLSRRVLEPFATIHDGTELALVGLYFSTSAYEIELWKLLFQKLALER